MFKPKQTAQVGRLTSNIIVPEQISKLEMVEDLR